MSMSFALSVTNPEFYMLQRSFSSEKSSSSIWNLKWYSIPVAVYCRTLAQVTPWCLNFHPAKFKLFPPSRSPYYSSQSFQDVCIHCSTTHNLAERDTEIYPMCSTCLRTKPRLRKRKRAQVCGPRSKKHNAQSVWLSLISVYINCVSNLHFH